MKKSAALFVAILLCFACLCGCGNAFSFPASAQEEYARVCALYNGKVRDFDALSSFTVTQSLTTSVPELSAVKDNTGKAVYPITETRTYMLDARNKEDVRSQTTSTAARFTSIEQDAVPTWETARLVFGDNVLCSPMLDEKGNQLSTAVSAIAQFDSRSAYLQDDRAFDTALQTVPAYRSDWFASLNGGVTEDGDGYTMRGTVAPQHYEDFFDVFAGQYDFKLWYTGGEDRAGRVYEWFLDPRFFASVTVDILTAREGIAGMTVTVRSQSSPHPIGGLTQELTVVATTRYNAQPLSQPITLPQIIA